MSLQTRIKAAGAAAAAVPIDAGRHRAIKRRTKRAVMDRMGYGEVARISAYIDPVLARTELRPAVEAARRAVETPTIPLIFPALQIRAQKTTMISPPMRYRRGNTAGGMCGGRLEPS